jgi:hypothetical protein
VRKFVLLFTVSLAQIIFGGIFLQGQVVREIALSSILTMAAYSTVLVDIIFFMIQ